MKHKMKMMFTGLCAVMLLTGTQSLKAQNRADSATTTLNLSDAVAMGLKNSAQVKVNMAKIEEAKASLQVAKDQRLPDFSVTGSYLRLNNPNVNLKTNSNNSGSGGTGSNDETKVSQAVYGMATVTYPVYAGLRIRNGIASAELLEKAVQLDAANDREGIALNIINAFVNLYKARAAVDLVKENLQQSRQRDTEFASLEKNGVLARNDLLKANLQTTNIEMSLFDAESNARLANVALALLLGLPEQTVIALDTAGLQTPVEPKALIDYELMAHENRKDVLALNYRSQAAAKGIDIAKSEYLPGIALSGGYVAADVPGLLTVTNAVNVSVGVKYSLSSLWKTKAKVQEATAKQHQLLASQEGLDNNIRYQINEAYQGYLVSNKKIEVYSKAIEQAAENYRIVKNKYNNSLATTTELLDADVAQLQAKLNYSFAKSDAVVAYKKLLQVSGILDAPKP